jgi:transcription factor CP2 and related proteins
MTSWHDIDDNLAADLDGSLSGLGEDLSTASYNMRFNFHFNMFIKMSPNSNFSSEALLALPSLTVFKQEASSPTTQGNNS